MPALVPKLRRTIISAVLLATAATLLSCASTKEAPRLVDDPDEHRESTIPWDKQEKWEAGANLANMQSDRR